MFLPPGFRFHPTDVELVKYYLKRKVMGKKFRFEAISELNIYKFSPWELPAKSFLQSKDHEWYFFCPRERKYASGTRTRRTTENGYWKITCKDKPVLHNEQAVGMVKTLVFHKGHAPRVERTDWFMHEYWIDDKDLNDARVIQDAYVLCRIFKKSGPGSKNGVQYGERFSEEDLYDEVEDAPSSAAFVLPNNQNISAVTSMLIPENTSSISMSEAGPSKAVLFAKEVPADDFDIDALFSFPEESEDSTLLSVENNNNLMPDDFNHDKNIGAVSCLDGNYINLSDLAEPSEGGLELNDLEVPLVCPTDASGSENFLTDSLYLSSNRCDYDEQNCYPVNSIGPTQHVSSMNESLVPLEGFNGQGDYLDVFHKMPDDFNHDKNIGAVSCLDGNYINLSDLAELTEGGLELNDLEVPLVCPTDASGSENFLTDSLYLSSNRCDYDEQNCYPVNSIGPTQHVSSMNKSLVPLEGFNGQGDYLNVIHKENDIRESANQGCNTTSYNVDFIPCRQPEEGIKHAVQDRKRGKQQSRSYSRVQQLLGSIPTRPASAAECHDPTTETERYKESTIFSLHGSSIHVNAKVSRWGGWCTRNALADKLVEFPYVWCCGGKLCSIDLGKKVVGCGSGLAFVLFLGDDFSLMWILIVAAFTKLVWYMWNSSIPLHGSSVMWIVMQVLCSFVLELYKQGDILNDDELYAKLVFQIQVNVLPYNMVDGCVL